MLLVVFILLITVPLMFLNGCAKKQEAEPEVETEQIEEAPADTTVAPPPAEGEEGAATEEVPEEEATE